MPKVTRRKTRKPARGRAAKAAASRRNAPFARLAAFVQTYALAGAAGAFVLSLVGLSLLWMGGYFGLVGARIMAASETAALAGGFAVDRVTLRGAHNTSHDEILSALDVDLGGSILHVDLGDARARIEALGWVRAASVSRLLPGSIHISVRERAPAAVWQLNGRLTLIDRDGAEIRTVGAHEYSQLPMIVGAGAPQAASGVLSALARYPALADRTYALVRVGERRWNIRLRNGVDVKLPEAGFEDAMESLEILESGGGVLDQEIEFIDLRDPDRVVLRERDQADR